MTSAAEVLRFIVDHYDTDGGLALYPTSPIVLMARQVLAETPQETAAPSATRGGEVESATAEPDHVPSGPGDEKSGPLYLRASAAPLAFRCAGSIRPVKVKIDAINPAASLGSAVHEALRPVAEGLGLQWDDLPGIAGRWGVELDELKMLAATGAKLWPEIAKHFEGAETEVELVHVLQDFGMVLSGHADALRFIGTAARGLDWKSGRKDRDYSQQMRVYCALVLLLNPWLTEATFTLVWLREGEIENHTMTREGLTTWLAELRSTVVEWDGTYRPDPDSCRHCRRAHECEARTAMVRRDIGVFLDEQKVRSDLVPATMLSMYRRAQLVEDAAQRVQALVRAHVDEHGPIEDTVGKISLVDEPRRDLDAGLAWGVLESMGFGDEEFLAVMRLSLTAIEKKVAKAAGRGKGAGAVRELNAKLEEAGAISVGTIRKIKIEEKRR
jgi:hypothetical protein